ncbi:hypothetical protein EHV15_34805 [Paenibacillus oralis]|uniref:Uncharacterized protein n=1 Tax=Paenibacillus oralis TaxID=2490856 RepID=A0A3P3T9N4_9BACL|nr:hypothetical protein [Paenibacillus oralis]RRJ54765.1 hypothetical protein EHV15_34805 [Paenibacillus oralis]
MFSKNKKFIVTMHPVFENAINRAKELESHLPRAMLEFISNESDMANDRRKRSLNVVTAIAEDVIHIVHPAPEDAVKLEMSIRTDIGIEGIYCPNGWFVKNGPDSSPQKYRVNTIVPPRYLAALVCKNMLETLKSDRQGTVSIFSGEIKSEEYKQTFRVTREFGVKFYDGDKILDILVFEETGEDNHDLFVRKMNKVTALMDQFYYEVSGMHPSLKMQIEVDFDKSGLLCPTNFEFVDPEANLTFNQ